MYRTLDRRSILQSISVALSAGFAGCSMISGKSGLDVEIQNEHSEAHRFSVEIGDFKEETTLDPGDEETFADVLSYPDSSTEVEANVQMDEDWEDAETFTGGKELKAFIVNIGTGGEVSYTFKGR